MVEERVNPLTVRRQLPDNCMVHLEYQALQKWLWLHDVISTVISTIISTINVG